MPDREYVTEVSVPEPGDGGRQALHSAGMQPEPLPDAEADAEPEPG